MMLDSPFIDVLIGVFFFFSIFSIVCSAVQELVASLFHLRSTNLERGVKALLGNDVASELYDNSYLKGLAAGQTQAVRKWKELKPSYIEAKAASHAVLRYLKKQTPAATTSETGPAAKAAEAGAILNTLKEFAAEKDGDLPKYPLLAELAGRLDTAEDDAVKAIGQIEAKAAEIFDEGMDRVSGWYVRQAKYIMFAVGFLLAAVVNADAIYLTNQLWKDENLRTSITANAVDFADLSTEQKASYCGEDDAQCIKTLNSDFPVGRAFVEEDASTFEFLFPERGYSLLGWLLTAIAASMGGPFWFDLLSKVTRLKGAGNPPQKQAAASQG